jgi:hypothetical protein
MTAAYTQHPLPLLLVQILVYHSWPFSHCHHTVLDGPGIKSFGVNAPFFTGCHSEASLGFKTANDVEAETF